jgi:molybdopterin/thiamine biosynthesis adenylyltransferase/nitroreductase
MDRKFDYHEAFARNLGWVTALEQEVLRNKRVAIAGLGGVGGSHVLTLARLGIGAFHLSDYDSFELANFNRQAGASMAALGRPKLEVLAEQLRAINPDVDVQGFPDGVTEHNLDGFLAGVDLYVDGLDFFVLDIRARIFAACAEAGIPAITAAPLGMGSALLNFLPGRMSFEEFFRLDGQPAEEQLVRFLLGLSPAMLQRAYLVDPRAVDFAARRGPSTAMACELCAGIAATQALKMLLHRGPVLAAPWGLHFDAYRNRMVRTWRPGGNRNPLQRLGLIIARRQLARMARFEKTAETDAMSLDSKSLRVLDAARWAPSGDNAQPWRFMLLDGQRFQVHGRDTRDSCIYDLQGHASLIALGALQATIELAASAEGRRAEIHDLPGDERHTRFEVVLQDDPDGKPHPLAPYIRLRTVQRRPLRTRGLTTTEKAELEAALGPGHGVRWFEGGKGRLAMAGLYFHSAGLRLALPEAYVTHRDAVAWQASESEDRIPVTAVGLNPLSARITAWAMQRWERVRNLDRFLGASRLARLELDWLPGVLCGAHFVLVANRVPEARADYLAAGRAMQRFWLTATKLGLQLQPQMTPLIFHEYVRDEVSFTHAPGMLDRAKGVSERLRQVLGADTLDHAVFMGRIGAGDVARFRSTRRPLRELLVEEVSQ